MMKSMQKALRRGNFFYASLRNLKRKQKSSSRSFSIKTEEAGGECGRQSEYKVCVLKCAAESEVNSFEDCDVVRCGRVSVGVRDVPCLEGEWGCEACESEWENEWFILPKCMNFNIVLLNINFGVMRSSKGMRILFYVSARLGQQQWKSLLN